MKEGATDGSTPTPEGSGNGGRGGRRGTLRRFRRGAARAGDAAGSSLRFDGGSDGEVTMGRNRSAFDRWQFRQRVGIDIGAVLDGAREMLERCETPVLTENPAGILATLLHQ